MKKIVINIVIIISIIMTMNAQNKKPTIILYDDGTYEKVGKEEISKSSENITDVWDKFQSVFKKGNTEEILNFIYLPFNIDGGLLEYKPDNYEIDCIKPICKLLGSVTKKKFIENINIIFDKKLKDEIFIKPNDEYIEGKSSKYNTKTFEYDLVINSKRNDIKIESDYDEISHKVINRKIIITKDAKIKFELYFAEFNGKIKLFSIYINWS